MQSIFNAGRVRRWHTNADLSHTEDYNDAHQGRVARILLALHPNPSAALLAAALTHDDGEAGPGDMSRDAKAANPELRELVRAAEHETYRQLWQCEPIAPQLLPDDTEWLKFADRLDTYMWMMHRAPWCAKRPDWIKARRELYAFVEQHRLEGVL